MRRILILGCAGAGKTFLAQQIATARGLPLIHLDRYYWRPNWVEPDKAAWAQQVQELVALPDWVMDGNYGGSLPARLAVADTAIYLDLPTWVCLWRVLRRTIRLHGKMRGDDLPRGCVERFDWEFTQYIFSYRREHRPRILNALSKFEGKTIILRRPREVAELIADNTV
jgi:adenylate kinase family enzyme